MKSEPVFKFRSKRNRNLFIISGPCVIETEKTCLTIAERLTVLSEKYSIDIIFKASYDKANRTSMNSFRGVGKKNGLKILEKVKNETGLPILTDIHGPEDASDAAQIVDVIQIPAFLCRQTDLLVAARKTGKTVNIKKGQFMAPQDMRFAVEKGGENTWLTERGTFFGYNRLVVDFASVAVLKSFGKPLIFDATHSVQAPGGGNGCSSGNREMIVPLARAAIGVGFDGLFFEVHPDPDNALCDGPNSITLKELEVNLPKLIKLHKTTAAWDEY